MPSRASHREPQLLAVLSATPFEVEPLLLGADEDGIGHDAVEQPVGRSGASKVTWPVARTARVAGVPLLFAVSGVGKANAAAALAALTRGWGVEVVLQVGVGGAYPGSGAHVGTVALALSETDLDMGVGRHPDWHGIDDMSVPGERATNVIDLSGPHLTRAAAVTGLEPVRFATSDSVTADRTHAAYLRDRFGVSVESMEGAAAARAASRLGVAFVEVRGVSNEVGERDRSRWRLRDASEAVCAVASAALPAIWEVTREHVG